MSDKSKAIFVAAIQQPESERAAWVRQACDGDAALCRRVEELLSVHSDANDSFLAPPVAVAPGIAIAPAPADGTLGDFRIVREIGRGGMGVVYEAEQISLKRRVALKVLPFAAVLDNRQLQRFRTEAMAAARLHHQHIVPVYHVGCDRAVHFYAMRYVEGHNVAQLLHGVRKATSPSPAPAIDLGPTQVDATRGVQSRAPAAETALLKDLSTDYSQKKGSFHRRIAALGIQAAEALDFAHQHGILHRDIKPSNLMLDQEGSLWITDFGLARIEGDAGLTMSGDLLGTLRYMSPEQVLGKRVVIDERTDVYSLGVTLYEMLTLRPAYQGADRAELLRNISFEEPAPARKVDPSIPADVETIVLKAMSHDPRHRYATARHLADDLQRFLDHKPILAKRPSWRVRAQKWVSRNKPLTASLVVVAVAVAVAGLAIWGALSQRQHVEGAAANLGGAPSQPRDASSDRLPLALAPGRTLPGVVPEPVFIPDAGRWQVITTKPRGVIRSAVWSPDETLIALAEANHVRIYDAVRLTLLHVLLAHSQPVRSVAWHPDGKRLASCSEDGTVRLWSSDGRPTHLLEGHTGPVYQVAWRPDGSQLASCSADGTVRLWSDEGKLIRTLDEGDRHVFGIDWSPDGELIATVGGDIWPAGPDGDPGDNSLRVWNGQTGDLVRKLDADVMYSGLCVAWRPDGEQLAVGFGNFGRQTHQPGDELPNAGVRIWNNDGTPGPEVGRDNGSVSALTWSPTGQEVAFGGRGGRVWIWDSRTRQLSESQIEQTPDIYSLVWNRAGSTLLIASRELVREWKHEGTSITVVAGIDRHLSFEWTSWQDDGTVIAAEKIGGVGVDFWSRDGRRRTAPDRPEGSIPGWWEQDSPKQRPDGTTAPDFEARTKFEPLNCFAWSREGWSAAASKNDRSVLIWDDQGKLIARCVGQRGAVESVAWSPDGTQLVSGGGDSVRIWNRDGTSGPVMMGHDEEVQSVAWSPDGQWIASGAIDSTVRIWRPDGTPGPIPVLGGHQGGVWRVAWSPDSQKLVSAGWLDHTLRVWDIATGKTEWQALLLDHGMTIALSPNGQLLHGERSGLQSELLYVIENRDGSMSLLSTDEFDERYGATLVKTLIAAKDTDGAVNALHALRRVQKRDGDSGSELRQGTFGPEVAEFFLAQGRYAEAAIVFTCVLKSRPEGHIFKRRGAAYMASKEYDKALADITKAVELTPDDSSNFTWFDQHLLWESPPEIQQKFLDLATRAIERSPNNYLVRAEYYAHRGEYEKASADLEAAVASAPQNATILNNYAWHIVCHLPDREARRAVELAQQAIDLKPADSFVWNTLGVAQCRAGEFATAITSLLKSQELGNTQHASWDYFFLAMAHEKLGHHTEAQEWFDKAVTWMDANKPSDPGLVEFRAEAGEVLGINAELPHKQLSPGTDNPAPETSNNP